MQVQALITALDEEIARLKQARELIGGASEPKRRGRPKGSTNKNSTKASVKARTSEGGGTPKRQMSAEGKARIAAAQKARWAAQKDTSGGAAKSRGAARGKAAGSLDRRTRAGKAAAAAAAKRSSARAGSKRATPPPTPTPAPEAAAQA